MSAKSNPAKKKPKSVTTLVNCPICSRQFVVGKVEQKLPRHFRDPEREEERCQGSNKPGVHAHQVDGKPVRETD